MPVTIDLYENPLFRPLFDRAHNAGLEEAREEGREGLQQILRALLTQQFGSLTPDAERRIEAASTAQLERWATRVIGAATIGEVFE